MPDDAQQSHLQLAINYAGSIAPSQIEIHLLREMVSCGRVFSLCEDYSELPFLSVGGSADRGADC